MFTAWLTKVVVNQSISSRGFHISENLCECYDDWKKDQHWVNERVSGWLYDWGSDRMYDWKRVTVSMTEEVTEWVTSVSSLWELQWLRELVCSGWLTSVCIDTTSGGRILEYSSVASCRLWVSLFSISSTSLHICNTHHRSFLVIDLEFIARQFSRIVGFLFARLWD